MRVQGLDGRVYSWGLTGYTPLLNDQGGSQYHARCRELLSKLFPLDRRLEEVPLPGSNGLTADFFLPARRLMVEVHGQQHYEFTPHFHKDKFGFAAAQERDRQKQRWCEVNQLDYVELPYDEDNERWTERILGR